MSKIICPNCNKYVEKSENCELCSFGLILNERYYLLKILGKNIGVTYQALDKKSKNNVVIKELSMKKLKSWKDEELFKREADTLMSLNHSQIPKFVDYFEVQSGKKLKYYTVMEFIYGETLSEINKDVDFNEEEVISIIKEISLVLDYLHNLTPIVIHRDIKPSNIIKRKSDGKYVLIDFDSVVNSLKLGGDSTIAGTFGYMAPEQFMGKASKKSDYYSLGVIALELLTKRNPRDLMKGVDLDWSELDLSDYMKKILDMLINKDPNKRIDSLETFNSNKEELIEIDLSEDLEILKKLRKDLKEINDIELQTSPFVILTIFAISMLLFITLNEKGTSIFFAILSVLSLIGGLNTFKIRHDKIEKEISSYFYKLKEKEFIFLEIIFKKNKEEFMLIKKHFYKFYDLFIYNGNLDTKALLKYGNIYKKNKDFNQLMKDLYLVKGE